MGKTIALFCDGTWNSAKQRYPTNVCLLSQSVASIAGVQSVHYLDGVGVNVERLMGGLFGIGLDRILLDAYKTLCADYEPGDEIFLFGFSRGAYMARSLVGMMRKCGVLKRDHLSRARDALDIYRRRERSGPDTPEAIAFRERYAAAWYVHPDSTDLQAPPAHQLTIRFMGIWETIGALGVPERLPFARLFNREYQFHDCDISSMVLRARHALAIDENRNALMHTPWTGASIRRINDMHGERRIEQVWFAGDHGSVGGGGLRRHLSSGALLWVAEAAEAAGLKLDDERHGHLARAAQDFDPLNGFLKNADGDPLGLTIQGRGPRLREAPEAAADVDVSVLRRAAGRSYLDEQSLRGSWRRATLSAVLYELREQADRLTPSTSISVSSAEPPSAQHSRREPVDA